MTQLPINQLPINSAKRIYLAGPMTGIAQHNYPAFHAAAQRLREQGNFVINPAEINPDTQCLGKDAPEEALWIHCMKRDIPELLTCDAVAVLRGWENSRGARLEVYIAARLGMPIFDAQTGAPLAGGKIALVKELLAFPSLQSAESAKSADKGHG